MFFYIGLLFVILLISILAEADKKNTLYFFACAWGILLIVSSLRYNIGADYKSYYDVIDSMIENGKNYKNEMYNRVGFGFKLIFDIAFITKIKLFLFIIPALITLIFSALALKKMSKDIMLSTVIFFSFPFFYFGTFTIIRQWIAISIIMYSYSFLLKKKYFIFILWLAIASLFHISAIFAIGLIISIILRVNRFYLFSLMLISFILIDPLVQMIINYFPFLISKIDRFSQLKGGNSLSYFIIIITSIIILLKPRLERIRQNNYIHINSLVLACIFIILLNDFGQISQRVTIYYFFPLIILIPDLILVVKENQRIILKTIVYTMFSLIYLYFLKINQHNSDIVPYNSIFLLL